MAGKRPIWYVEFPLYQYNEDVKALAKSAGLRVIDAQFDVGDGVGNAPLLTKAGEVPEDAKPRRGRKPKSEVD